MAILIMNFPKLTKKSTNKAEKDPIKDKYNVKIGFFKNIQLKLIKFYNYIKNNKSIREDIDSFLSMLVGVFTYGVLGSFAISLLGVGISIMSIFGIGSLLWLIENKFTEIITRILGSIKLVQIHN